MDLIEARREQQTRQLVLMALTECADMPLSKIIKEMESDEDLLDALMSLSPRDMGLSASESAPNPATLSEVTGEVPAGPEAKVPDRAAAPKSKKKRKKESEPEAPKQRKTKKKAPPKAEDDAPDLALNLRTEEGRDQYDAQVAKALRQLGEEVASGEIRKIVGGSPAQVRASLDRLIEQGRVEYRGETRATRYWLAG